MNTTKERVSIKTARIFANMTVTEACSAMRITRPLLLSWENGIQIPDHKHAIMLAETYGMPMDVISFQREDNVPNYDHTALISRILDKYHTLDEFAAVIEMKPTVLKSRLANKTDFRADEMRRICTALDVRTDREVNRLFFTRTSDMQLVDLAEQYLSMNDEQRTLMLQIMELVDGRPDRMQYATSYTGRMRDLPAALAQI